MNYKDAINYISGFTDWEKIPGSGYTTGTENLTRFDLLLRLLENPQDSFQSIVIAGTKGKGSVSAMVESILREGGQVTGLFTSPHLQTYRERIRVRGQIISPEHLARMV